MSRACTRLDLQQASTGSKPQTLCSYGPAGLPGPCPAGLMPGEDNPTPRMAPNP